MRVKKGPVKNILKCNYFEKLKELKNSWNNDGSY
jgi:hypothetical protein